MRIRRRPPAPVSPTCRPVTGPPASSSSSRRTASPAAAAAATTAPTWPSPAARWRSSWPRRSICRCHDGIFPRKSHEQSADNRPFPKESLSMRTSPARLFVRSFAILGLLAVLPVRGQAPAYLVKDINPDHPAPRIEDTVAESEGVGSLFYYAADDGTHGEEIWRTDGTPAGTFLLKDVCPGACTFLPRALTGSNGLLFFVANDPLQGLGLWQSDGTPGGTSLVKADLNGLQGFGDFVFPALADAGGKLLFTVLNASSVVELWVTDGTQGGTHAVGDAAQGFRAFPPLRFLAVDHGQVLFAAQDSLTSWEPWVTDGTNAGTHRLSEVNPGAGSPIRFNNLGPAGQEGLVAPWGGFVFVGDDGSHGPEIWRT